MKKLGSILRLDFVPSSADAGLLVLRLWLGLSMLALHGADKVANFQRLSGSFPDPLRIGHRNSLALAVVGEVICPILIMLGLFTRGAALGSAITMSVAFFLYHKAALKTGPATSELAFIYLGGFIVLLLAGPGKFARDGKGAAPRKFKPAKD